MVEDLHFIFRMLALSQALLLALLLVVSPRSGLFGPYRVALLTAGAVVAFCVYLVMPFRAGLPHVFALPLEAVATAIPSILWLTAYWFFEDRYTVPPWLVILTLFYVTVWMSPESQQLLIIPAGDLQALVFSLVPQLIKLALVLHVLYMAIEGREKDLVDLRAGLRFPLAVGGGALAILVIVVEIWAGDTVGPIVEVLGAMLMFALALGANVLFVRAGLASGTAAPVSARVPGTGNKEGEFLGRIERAMQERFYANHGATLDDLAGQLALPAYRLRKLINHNLGYRNFNHFLNHYRVAEASRRLRTESSPILTIALDVGFKSLSSFNAAFRAEHGMTPSDWRRCGEQPDPA